MHTYRLLILQGKGTSTGMGDDLGVITWPYNDYQSDIKAWNNDHAPDRWHKMMQKHNKKYLIMYESKPKDVKWFNHMYDLLFNGRLIQGTGQHEIFLYVNGSKHSFPNWDSFVDSGYDLASIKSVSVDSLHALTTGDIVDPLNIYFHKHKVEELKSLRSANTAVIGAQWAPEADTNGDGDGGVGMIEAETQAPTQARGQSHKKLRGRVLEEANGDISSSSDSYSSSDSIRTTEHAASGVGSVRMRRSLKLYKDPSNMHPPESLFTPTKKNGLRYGAEELTDEERTVILTKRVEAAMVFDWLNATEVTLVGNRKHNNSVHFVQTLFNHAANGLNVTVHVPSLSAEAGSVYEPQRDEALFQFQVWPGVYTGDCPGFAPDVRPDHSKGADRGMILAHRAIWEQFVKARENSAERMKIAEKDDILLVFEDDPYPMVCAVSLGVVYVAICHASHLSPTQSHPSKPTPP